MNMIELNGERILIDYELLLNRINDIQNQALHSMDTLRDSPKSVDKFNAYALFATVTSVERMLNQLIEESLK